MVFLCFSPCSQSAWVAALLLFKPPQFHIITTSIVVSTFRHKLWVCALTIPPDPDPALKTSPRGQPCSLGTPLMQRKYCLQSAGWACLVNVPGTPTQLAGSWPDGNYFWVGWHCWVRTRCTTTNPTKAVWNEGNNCQDSTILKRIMPGCDCKRPQNQIVCLG